jgi:hypothetical protein
MRWAEDGEYIELVAMAPMAEGDEILISYTGEDVDAYTSQRLMAQYGFVLVEGNIADRLPFELPEQLAQSTLDMDTVRIIYPMGWG